MKIIVEKEGDLLDYLYNHLDMPKKRIKQYLTHGSIYVNNHKTKIYHIMKSSEHIVNKDIVQIMRELAPIYQELDNDFQAIDVVDLIYYERWLNG